MGEKNILERETREAFEAGKNLSFQGTQRPRWLSPVSRRVTHMVEGKIIQDFAGSYFGGLWKGV